MTLGPTAAGVCQTIERKGTTVETLDENVIRFLIVSFCYLDATNAPSCAATVSTSNDTTASWAD